MIPLEHRLFSESFKTLLENIAENNKGNIRLILESLLLLDKERAFDKDYIRNIAYRVNDNVLSYCPKGQESILTDDNNHWSRKNRQTGKIGKVLRKLFVQFSISFTDVEIEKLVYLIKTNELKGHNFKILKGEKLVDVYNKHYDLVSDTDNIDSLSTSCMRNEPRDYFKVYKDYAKMLVLYNKDNKIIGRAILWQTDCHKKIIDRIYGNENTVNLFKSWARQNDYYYKLEQTYSNKTEFVAPNGEVENLSLCITIDNRNYEYYPYMDTFSYLSARCSKDAKLTNIEQEYYIELTDTDGNTEIATVWSDIYQTSIEEEDAIFSDYHNTFIYSEHAVWSEIENSYLYGDSNEVIYLQYKNDYGVKEYCKYSDKESCWIYEEDAIYSDYYDDYIFSDDAVYSEYHESYLTTTDNNTVYSEYHEDYLDKDDSQIVYSEYYDDYFILDKDNIVYSVIDNDYYLQEDTVYSKYHETYLRKDDEEIIFMEDIKDYIKKDFVVFSNKENQYILLTNAKWLSDIEDWTFKENAKFILTN